MDVSTAASGCSSRCRSSSFWRSASPSRPRSKGKVCRRRSTAGRPRRSPSDLADRFPDRFPGTSGALGAQSWFVKQLVPYGFDVKREAFTATIRGHKTRLVNLVAEKAGLSPREIVVMAHRDDSGTGGGLNDNASGTAALIELARSYAPLRTSQLNSLPYSIAFVSTDGAEEGALGAAHFAAKRSTRRNAVAVINLDSIGGRGNPRLEFGGDTPRSPAPGLLETMQKALNKESGGIASRPSALDQLVSLAFPFNAYEQAPFVSGGMPAVTITTAHARPAGCVKSARLRVAPITEIGLATQDAVNAMEEGISLAQGSSSYIFLGQRLIEGWAIELVLIAMLLPFIAAAVDLFARCRRRRIPIAPAFRSYRSRLAFWGLGGLVFLLFGAAGFLGGNNGRPAPLNDVRWPIGALLVLALLGRRQLARHARPSDARVGRSRRRRSSPATPLRCSRCPSSAFSSPRRIPTRSSSFSRASTSGSGCRRYRRGHAAFAPSSSRLASSARRISSGRSRRTSGSAGMRRGTSRSSSPSVTRRATLFVIALAGLAAAGQLFALAGNRYAPYPAPGEAPRRGPLRDLIRTLVLAQRRRAALTQRSGAARKRPRRS